MTFTEIKADADFLLGTDSTTYLDVDKTRNANLALDEATSIIIGCDGTWQFDDSNYTDRPVGTTDIVLNQQDYSFNEEHLYVEAVEVKGQDGKWIKLQPIDVYLDQENTTISDLMNVAGEPQYYDKVGDSVLIYPVANYNQDDSLRVHFQRKMEHFVIGDTTKTAGFAPHLSRFISVCMAYDFAIAFQHPKQSFLLAEKNRYTDLVKKFYSKRVKDERRSLSVIQLNNK